MKPQDWMAHMERKRNELENAGHEMDDETFLTHVIASLPPRRISSYNPYTESKTKGRRSND